MPHELSPRQPHSFSIDGHSFLALIAKRLVFFIVSSHTSIGCSSGAIEVFDKAAEISLSLKDKRCAATRKSSTLDLVGYLSHPQSFDDIVTRRRKLVYLLEETLT